MINKDDFLKMASDDQYLSGIYNYCDRWCEKCPYTSRCLNYTALQEFSNGKDVSQLSIEESYGLMKDVFDLTTEILTDFADKQGIDISDIEEPGAGIDEELKKVEEHPLSLKAAEYFQEVFNWLETRNKMVKSKFDEYMDLTEMGLDEDQQFDKAKALYDALETIKWYHTFIRLKINSALNSKYFDDMINAETGKEDENLSAKLALIGCGKSLDAWNSLYKILSEDEDELLKILAYLKQLLNGVKKEFPFAELYKRPYFD